MSIKDYAKRNNLFYENIAAYLNELDQLGYAEEELDAPKHVIASAHSVVEQGQSITNTLGHLNEFVAAFRGRDNFGEHNKDHRNNIVGMILGNWLKATLGRKPTLSEITIAVGVLAEERMIASYRPKGDSSKLSALTSSALASFWSGTIRSSTIQQLDSRKNKILNQIKQMSDDGRMGRLQQFVASSAVRKLKFTDKKNKKKLIGLVHGISGNNALTSSDTLQRPAVNSVDPFDPDIRKRDRGDLQGLGPAGQPDTDGFTPGHGDLFEPSFGGPTELQNLNPDHSDQHDTTPNSQANSMASLAADDELDIYQMAEEVFSSLTLDDWAIIPDDNDPFDNRDPFRDGVKWVPGLERHGFN